MYLPYICHKWLISSHFWEQVPSAEVQSPLPADELVVASDELPEFKACWADTLDSPGPAKYEDWMWAHECF